LTAWLLWFEDLLSSFLTYNRLCNKINTMDVNGTSYPFGAHEFILGL